MPWAEKHALLGREEREERAGTKGRRMSTGPLGAWEEVHKLLLNEGRKKHMPTALSTLVGRMGKTAGGTPSKGGGGLWRGGQRVCRGGVSVAAGRTYMAFLILDPGAARGVCLREASGHVPSLESLQKEESRLLFPGWSERGLAPRQMDEPRAPGVSSGSWLRF